MSDFDQNPTILFKGRQLPPQWNQDWPANHAIAGAAQARRPLRVAAWEAKSPNSAPRTQPGTADRLSSLSSVRLKADFHPLRTSRPSAPGQMSSVTQRASVR